jgi:hypothetical protein
MLLTALLKRAQILLAADAGRSDEEIARAVAVGGSTVYRTAELSLAKSRLNKRIACGFFDSSKLGGSGLDIAQDRRRG